MMSTPWEVAKTENRRELVLHGSTVSKVIEETNNGELPDLIWKLQQLNFLEVSNIGINNLSGNISELENLARLCLRDNRLTCLPSEMSNLKKLTMLDASGNSLTAIDQLLFDSWTNLTSLNVSGNQLTLLPSLDKLEHLQYLNVANNKLEAIPGLSHAKQLLQIEAQCNVLLHLPDDMCELNHLRQLHVHSNQLRDLPTDLWKCSKLKEMHAHGNKFSDNRLRKMTEDGKTSCSAILEYLRKQNGPKGKGKGKAKGRVRGSSRGDVEEEGAASETRKVIEVVRPDEESHVQIQVMESVLAQRPYLVCCVIRGVNFGSDQLCRSFIKFQESLHDSVCERRLKAAMGSHDMASIVAPLEYVTGDANTIKITPLNSNCEEKAHTYILRLRQKAEEERKRLKRNTVTGVYKYLWLLKDATNLVHMRGADGLVLSIPPITNCHETRLSSSTQDIFLEVSGSDRLDLCKSIMDSLLVWLTEHCSNDDGILRVEQARVVCSNTGQTRVLYPSATDLQNLPDGIGVRRP